MFITSISDQQHVDTQLPTPAEIEEIAPLSVHAAETVSHSRKTIANILRGDDPRLLVIVGPCSISDSRAGEEYAERLSSLSRELENELFLVMRTFFHKPRTSLGWKGLLNDPFLDGSCSIEEGLLMARRLLLNLAKREIPAATEAVDPLTDAYIADLISWTSIGARTSESQTHREYASSLESPVGFKNTCDGNISAAINAVISAQTAHTFIGVNPQGQMVRRQSSGNQSAHIVLRGGSGGVNYDKRTIASCEEQLLAQGLAPGLIVDCSHGNSGKDPARQGPVFEEVLKEVLKGQKTVRGLMLESNLLAGAQKHSEDTKDYIPGLSLTDPCISWDSTEQLLRNAAERIGKTQGEKLLEQLGASRYSKKQIGEGRSPIRMGA